MSASYGIPDKSSGNFEQDAPSADGDPGEYKPVSDVLLPRGEIEVHGGRMGPRDLSKEFILLFCPPSGGCGKTMDNSINNSE